MALPKSPTQELLQRLDSVFGPEYFEHGRLILTVARDVPGVMKVAHKLQNRINETLGSVVEVIVEHVKHEFWSRLHEASANVGLYKGAEVPECQVTHIPDGIRVNPYQRENLPTFEVLLLWEDTTSVTRGHILYSARHPEHPNIEDLGEIYSQIEQYFVKRWIIVELSSGLPFADNLDDAEQFEQEDARAPIDSHIGAGVGVTILACHAYGFARGKPDCIAHVRNCQPLAFRSVSDESGRAKLCFLPADINKIHVAETDRFHSTEVMLPKANIVGLDKGPTIIPVKLAPKALASVRVHVFAMPSVMPTCEFGDGVVDWAAEERVPVQGASVRVNRMADSDASLQLAPGDDGSTFVAQEGLPEGAVDITVECPGYEIEERPTVLLVGTNEFYVPVRRS